MESMSVDRAAASFLERLSSEENDTPASDTEPGTTKEDVSAEQEPAEGDASTGQEAAPAENEAEPKYPERVKVKVDGEEIEVDFKEVLAGYSRTRDYTKKTMALAEERKKFEAERQAVVQERQLYAERLKRLEDALATLEGTAEPDWAKLREELEPAEFAAEYAAWKSRQEALQKLKAEREAAESKLREEHERAYAERLQQEMEALLDALPELRDPDKRVAFGRQIEEYASRVGFAPDEIRAFNDHRALLVLHKAALYDKLMQEKEKAKGKVVAGKDGSMPPGAKSPASVPPQYKAVRERFLQSRKVNDAAKVFELLLED